MSREYPRYPLVGVGAIVIKNGEILLIRRGGAEPIRVSGQYLVVWLSQAKIRIRLH